MQSLKSKPSNPKLYIFSGAGLSAESGIPTFRGNDGTWTNVDVNEVCNILTWQVNPVPAEPHHYGRVLAMGASEGIAQLHPDVQATMDAGR